MYIIRYDVAYVDKNSFMYVSIILYRNKVFKILPYFRGKKKTSVFFGLIRK